MLNKMVSVTSTNIIDSREPYHPSIQSLSMLRQPTPINLFYCTLFCVGGISIKIINVIIGSTSLYYTAFGPFVITVAGMTWLFFIFKGSYKIYVRRYRDFIEPIERSFALMSESSQNRYQHFLTSAYQSATGFNSAWAHVEDKNNKDIIATLDKIKELFDAYGKATIHDDINGELDIIRAINQNRVV